MEVVKPGGTLLTVTERGYGKRTEIDEYRVQSRGGVGIINIATSERNGQVVGVAYVQDGDELLLITQQGMILRMPTDDVRAIGRATQGVTLIDLEERRQGRVDRAAGREGRRRGRRADAAGPSTVADSALRVALVAAGAALVVAALLAAAEQRAARRSSSPPRACATSPRCSKISTVVFEPARDGIVDQLRHRSASTRRRRRSRTCRSPRRCSCRTDGR